jgi:hypothetical protein
VLLKSLEGALPRTKGKGLCRYLPPYPGKFMYLHMSMRNGTFAAKAKASSGLVVRNPTGGQKMDGSLDHLLFPWVRYFFVLK